VPECSGFVAVLVVVLLVLIRLTRLPGGSHPGEREA